MQSWGGDSGSPVEHECEGVVYAIHTNNFCVGSGVILGTVVDHPNLQDALIPNYIDCGTREPSGVLADCNDNGVLDTQDICDIAAGTSQDLNGNCIPDECESPIGGCCVSSGACSILR